MFKVICKTGSECNSSYKAAGVAIRAEIDPGIFVVLASCMDALTKRKVQLEIGVKYVIGVRYVKYSAQQDYVVTKCQPIRSASVRCNNPPELSGKSCPLFLPFFFLPSPLLLLPKTFTQSLFTTTPQSICLSLLLAISVARSGLSRIEKTGCIVD